jgi:hypothetical protein
LVDFCPVSRGWPPCLSALAGLLRELPERIQMIAVDHYGLSQQPVGK